MRSAVGAAIPVLGVGLIIAPLAAAASDFWVTVVTACAIGLAAVTFRTVPFGGGGARDVRELPTLPRWIYGVGFLGGGTFMLSTSLALFGMTTGGARAIGVGASIVLGGLIVFAGLSGILSRVRLALTMAVAIGLVSVGGPGAVVVEGITPVTAVAAGLLMCVGWESLARDVVPVGRLVAAVGLVVAIWFGLVAVAGGTGVVVPAGSSGGPAQDGLAVVTAGLLVTYAATNARAVAAFTGVVWWRSWVAPAAIVVVMAVVAGAVPAGGRWWLLILPGVAVTVLYVGFLVNGLRKG